MNKQGDLRTMLERNPGATEASVRSELRSQRADSSVLDAALADGSVVRRAYKLYRREDVP